MSCQGLLLNEHGSCGRRGEAELRSEERREKREKVLSAAEPQNRRAGEPQNRRAAVRRNSTKYRVEIKGKTTFCSRGKYSKKRPNSCKKCLTLEARFGTITKLAQSGYIALKREIAQK